MRNLAEALDEFLAYKRVVLKAAAGAAETDETVPSGGTDASAPGPMTPNRPRLWYGRQQEAAKKRHERLVEQSGGRSAGC